MQSSNQYAGYRVVPLGPPGLRQTGPVAQYGAFRAQRLRSIQPTSAVAWLTDLLWSVLFPASFGVAIAAAAVGLLEIEGIEEWVRDNPISPQVVSSLSALVTYVVSLRLSQNLGENAQSIRAFNEVCGAVINLAVWSRSLVSRAEFTYLTLPDGRGGLYQTTRFGLILASMPYAVKLTYRGNADDVHFAELPIGGDAQLLTRANALITSWGGFAGVSPFTALIMMIGEYIHELEEADEIKPSELTLLFRQLNALSDAEGKIASSVSFSYPRILRTLLYGVFLVWLFVLSLTEIAPASGWHSLWLVGLLSMSSVGLYAISNRYANPFAIRSTDSTQTPLVAIACRETETAIDGVFAFHGRLPKATNATAKAKASALVAVPAVGGS